MDMIHVPDVYTASTLAAAVPYSFGTWCLLVWFALVFNHLFGLIHRPDKEAIRVRFSGLGCLHSIT
jgi:hypothetical protein